MQHSTSLSRWKLVAFLAGLGVYCQTDATMTREVPYPAYFGPAWYNATAAPTDLAVTLTARIEMHDDALIVAYKLENHTDKAFDVVRRPAREWDGGEREAQVDFHRGRLMLSRIILPEHHGAGTDCQGYRTPEMLSLEPGATIFDSVRVPLPAQVNVSMREQWLWPTSRRPVVLTRSRWTSRVSLIIGAILDPYDSFEQVTFTRTLTLPRHVQVLDDDQEPDLRPGGP